ncbi:MULTISPECIES: DUF982 domain-containing protein [Mesorhizobium]|uniref:DUF982 domain-containing protein n=1 Tax=Mesorhizobium TaxID=68287 RepID=UPI0003CF21BC|nr:MULTISPECIES: DUF982 domain-containing protein [Mesorhizobium]ESY63977.1 hypothetical protein X742_27495 [Mesorhizobium sp. LNHC232B00]WJI39161.1 DUF982 domain-containing protein [Mesorhizobium opportunistum]
MGWPSANCKLQVLWNKSTIAELKGRVATGSIAAMGAGSDGQIAANRVHSLERHVRTGHFRKPIVIQPGRIDRDRVVVSVSDAAEVLLRDWPKPTSERRLAAIRACLAVMRGEKPPRVARQAFIVAAKDARILLGDQI